MRKEIPIIMGVAILLTLAATLPALGKREAIDPDLSFVELTAEGMAGLTTCPSGDGPEYIYVKVTCIDQGGEPVEGLPAEVFEFILSDQGCDWYGTLSCTFTPADPETNVNGELRFSIVGDTSIVGDMGIEVKVIGIPINDLDIIPCRSPDYAVGGQPPSGAVDLGDFIIFGQDWGQVQPRSDFDWSGGPNGLADFIIFGQHWGH